MGDIKSKIDGFLLELHNKGIPVPLFRDMANGQVSITYTMLVISFTLAILAQFNLFGLSPDKTLELLSYTGVGYIGRKWQKGTVSTETETKGE